MARLLLILLLVAFQWPQAIAGSLAICLCHPGAVGVDGGQQACHCQHSCGHQHEAEELDGCTDLEQGSVPLGETALSSACGGEHLSLYAGDALKSVPVVPALDLTASTPVSCADLRTIAGHGQDHEHLSCDVLRAATATVVMRC